MNLYLISQDENNDYDTYDSMIVAAESEGEAVNIHPDGEDAEWNGRFPVWASSPNKVSALMAGKSAKDIQKGVVLSSFNAG